MDGLHGHGNALLSAAGLEDHGEAGAWLFGAVGPAQPEQAVLAKATWRSRLRWLWKVRWWLRHAQWPRSSSHSGPILRGPGRGLTPSGTGSGVGSSAAAARLAVRGRSTAAAGSRWVLRTSAMKTTSAQPNGNSSSLQPPARSSGGE